MTRRNASSASPVPGQAATRAYSAPISSALVVQPTGIPHSHQTFQSLALPAATAEIEGIVRIMADDKPLPARICTMRGRRATHATRALGARRANSYNDGMHASNPAVLTLPGVTAGKRMP